MKFRRRKYINDTRVQMRIALLFILIALIGNIISIVVFNSLATREFDAILWSTHIHVESTDELVRPIFFSVNIVNLVFITVLLILAAYLMAKKTSGPLYRMSQDIRKIAGGDLSCAVVLRQKDDMKDVADELNAMTGGLRERFTVIRDHYGRISESVKALENAQGNREETLNDCASILKDIDVLEEELKNFRY